MHSELELKSCPFCGWALTEDEGLCKWDKDEFGDTVDQILYTGVCCPGCSAFVPINAHDKADAIAAWNRREASTQSTGGSEAVEVKAPAKCTTEMADAALRRSLGKDLNTLTNTVAMQAIVDAALAFAPPEGIAARDAVIEECIAQVHGEYVKDDDRDPDLGPPPSDDFRRGWNTLRGKIIQRLTGLRSPVLKQGGGE